jgi:hypothetical protein
MDSPHFGCTTETGGYAKRVVNLGRLVSSKDAVKRCFAAAMVFQMLDEVDTQCVTQFLTFARASVLSKLKVVPDSQLP